MSPRLTIACILFSLSVSGDAFGRTEIAKLVPNDIENLQNGFGWSVAIDGDYAVVGAPVDNGFDWGGEGAVYVFRRVGTNWVQQAKLKASDASVVDQLGLSVAIDGDRIVAGAPRVAFSRGGFGAAYVFRRDDGGTPDDPEDDTWIEEAKLTAPAPELGDIFGLSVSICGDVIVAGKPGYEYSRGAAHVFRRTGLTWSHEAALVGSDTHIGDKFGKSVTISGDVVVVSAKFQNPLGADAGAYVFRRTGTDWVQEDNITSARLPSGEFLAPSVAISGDALVVGGYQRHDPGPVFGSTYVFRRGADAWCQQAKLTPVAPRPWDEFGSRVSIDGTSVLIGAPSDDHAGPHSGSAYLFSSDGTRWRQVDKLTASDPYPGMRFGTSVSTDAQHALVGNPAGVYVFTTEGAPATLSDLAAFQNCFSGDGTMLAGCEVFDLIPDGRVDLRDYSQFMQTLGGP